MVTVSYFDVRDVFRAPRAGLSGKKIWVSLNGIFLAWLIYSIFTYLSRLTIGMSFKGIWGSQGLWPFPACAHYSWGGWVVFLIGFVSAGIVLLITALAVCRLAYQQFKGDDFYASSDSWSFARSKWSALILPPLAIIGILLLFVVSGLILGLLGNIPYLGGFIVVIAMIPAILFAMIAVLALLVLFSHFALGPAIAATTGGDAMDVLVQLFSCAWSQPWRFLVYHAVLKWLTIFAVHVFLVFVVAALWLIRLVMAPVFGMKLLQIFHTGFTFAQLKCPVLTVASAWCAGACTEGLRCPNGLHRCLDSLFAVGSVDPASGATAAAGYLFGIVLFLVMLTVMAYFFSTWFSGQTIIYLILRKRKDEENLLNREDDAEWEEELDEAYAGESGPVPVESEVSDSGEGGGETSGETGESSSTGNTPPEE